MKTYLQLERSRNRRLWITGVIVPGLVLASTLSQNPRLCDWIGRKKEQAKMAVKNVFEKGERK